MEGPSVLVLIKWSTRLGSGMRSAGFPDILCLPIMRSNEEARIFGWVSNMTRTRTTDHI